MTELYRKFEQYPNITTDSRNVLSDSIFFALKGENFDGNRFASVALENGAAFAVVDDPSVAVSDKYIIVEDTLSTLQHLSTYHRRVLGIPILAITGTNGKTTTKELTARVLSCRYNVAMTKGNLNNHVGVPLTLLSMRKGTEFGVVEMGASARGEIDLLCNIVQPDYGIITNIGKAHLEGFGSIEGVRQAKGELYDYLAAHNGLAFYRKDDPVLNEMIGERYRLLAKSYDTTQTNGIKSHLSGDYNRYNIAAAAAIGEYFGIVSKEIAESIESYKPDNLRSQRKDTGKNTLILDCYNANPSSMKAALDNFEKEHTSKTKSVILGDMLELGQYTEDEHVGILGLLAKHNIKKVYLVGEHFTKAAANTGIKTYVNITQLAEELTQTPIKGNLILIKGSRGTQLDKLVEYL